MAERSPKISCRGLWKVFGPHADGFMAAQKSGGARPEGHIAAVEDVSFDVTEGEILVVMGLSGSGKSTLIRCITRLIEPTAGEVVYDGRNLLQASPRELIELRRHKMGMVFQHFGLLPHRNVLSNVAFPLEVQGAGREEREARAREMIRLVGLEGRESYFPRELSGGQQQRVGIARSLAVEPDIWFLDEPFSALDPLIRREMQDEFLRLQRMLKKTIVFITHDFDEAVRLADRIGIMKSGRLVQLCAPEEMVTSPADDYVAEFTKNAPRGRIITVRSIMEDVPSAPNGANVRGDDKVGDVARKALVSEHALTVTDAEGRPIGRLTREAVIRALFEERTH
ncbi:MAG: glycine betaine/L-proline ABC transporter ATP-binding protein [Parvibaculaceae bacterium]